jgi:hypothetical protein
MEWFSEFWASLTLNRVLFGGGLFLITLALNFLAIFVVIIKIPANYFSSVYTHSFMPGKPWLFRWSAVILKNLLGFFLIAVGIVMLIGPGQGILTILLGLIMLDIPGKRPLEAKIIKRPAVAEAINKIRSRFKKPPLILD